MENLTIIQSEKIATIENELQEIKSLLLNIKSEEWKREWLTKQEARKMLNVCQKTLDTYLSRKVLPYSRYAGKIYIKASDIQNHLEKHYIKS